MTASLITLISLKYEGVLGKGTIHTEIIKPDNYTEGFLLIGSNYFNTHLSELMDPVIVPKHFYLHSDFINIIITPGSTKRKIDFYKVGVNFPVLSRRIDVNVKAFPYDPFN